MVRSTAGARARMSGQRSGKECVDQDPVNLNASNVDVLILLDASDSMGIAFGAGTRSSVLADVLSNLVDAYQQWIRFGFAQFPGADAQCPGQMVTGCCAGPPSVGIAPGNGTAVEQAIGNLLPLAGNTPTALALQRAHAYYAGLNDGVAARYVLLATDGLPSCTLAGALSSSQSADADAGGPNACQDAVAQVQALANDGIDVLVLAVGAELTDDPEGPPDCLDQMAQAGGRPQSLTGPGYYSAASPETLLDTVEQIFGGVEQTSCSFELNPHSCPGHAGFSVPGRRADSPEPRRRLGLRLQPRNGAYQLLWRILRPHPALPLLDHRSALHLQAIAAVHGREHLLVTCRVYGST